MKCAGRISMKAVTPSLKSFVWESVSLRSSERAIASDSGRSKAFSSARLQAKAACAGASANRVASSRATDFACPAGATRLISPHASAIRCAGIHAISHDSLETVASYRYK